MELVKTSLAIYTKLVLGLYSAIISYGELDKVMVVEQSRSN